MARIRQLNTASSSGIDTSNTVILQLSWQELHAQYVYENTLNLLTFLSATLGECDFKSGTIMCGEVTLASLLKKADPGGVTQQLTCITAARHWYFHHTDDDIVFADVVVAMHRVIAMVRSERGDSDKASTCPKCVLRHTTPLPSPTLLHPCSPPADPFPKTGAGANDHVAMHVTLRPLSMGMAIPTACLRTVVGRAEAVGRIVDCLAGESAAAPRVLIHGIPGVGKDVVAAEVVHNKRIQYSRIHLHAHA